jgi:hypothetical protein
MGAGDGEAGEPARAAGEAGSAYGDVTFGLRPTASSMVRAKSLHQRLAELAAVRDLQRGGETDCWRGGGREEEEDDEGEEGGEES